ncbi:hypothetical protein ACT8MX_003305 [Escherichia albertii]
MKYSWFNHDNCTTAEADELQQRYRARGVQIVRELNPDHVTWTISARLPEREKPPRVRRCWQNWMWI